MYIAIIDGQDYECNLVIKHPTMEINYGGYSNHVATPHTNGSLTIHTTTMIHLASFSPIRIYKVDDPHQQWDVYGHTQSITYHIDRYNNYESIFDIKLELDNIVPALDESILNPFTSSKPKENNITKDNIFVEDVPIFKLPNNNENN